MSLHRPQAHESAPMHVSGTARYTGDLPEPQGLLHAWPVLSPYAHARVLSVNSSAALEVPGVVRILGAADVTGHNNVGPVRHDEPLFPATAMYHSHPIVWVLADSEDAARAGADRVEVEYEALEPILGIPAAIAQNSFHNETPARMERGDVDAALEHSEHTLSGELHIGGQDHFYLETQHAQAWLDEDAQLFVCSSTQHPSETQTIVSEVTGLPLHRVTVQALRMGGGFGGKETQANPYAAVAALGAQLTGRPVRVRLTRHLDMRLTGKRHPFYARYTVGFGANGMLEGLRLELFSDGGWSLDLSEAILYRAMFHADNCYFLPHVQISGRICKTHVTSHTAFRGFGGPQGMVVIEEIMDRIARSLGLEPETVRERNFYAQAAGQSSELQGQEAHERSADAWAGSVHPQASEPRPEFDAPQGRNLTHYGQTIDDVRIGRIWSELMASSDFAARRLEQASFNAAHPYLRRGLAITPVKFGISFTATQYNQAGALVLIYQDGSVQVNHGGTEMGQGLHTKVAQIAAHTLGIPQEGVKVMVTRTDKVPNTSATAASSGTDLNGAAVRDACEHLLERLQRVAAGMIGPGVHPQDVRIEGGQVGALGQARVLEFREVVRAAYMQRVQLSATGFYRTPRIFFDRATGQGTPFRYYAWGAAVSEVELDTLTGMWSLERVDVLHDCGDSLNPLIDRGQIEGGFVQGMGWLTMEELVWDELGRLRTFAPSTYKIPTLAEVPADFRVKLLPRAGEDKVVYGSKAVGEPPFMLGISVREALRDALARAHPEAAQAGVLLNSPATPEALLAGLERLKALETAVPAD